MRQKLSRILAAAAILASTFSVEPAYAYDWSVVGTVTVVEASYVPSGVDFQINTAAGSCAAGSFLYWSTRGADEASQIANVQAILSVLMTAKVSGKQVQIFGTNSGCTVQFLYLVG